MRKAAIPYLKSNKILLFYAHDYEGLECEEYISYVGVPFTARKYIRYYIQEDYIRTKRRIIIVHTTNYYFSTVAKIIEADLNDLDIPIFQTLKVPYEASDMSPIVESALLHLLGYGIIITLIDGSNRYEFYKQAYLAGLRSPLYTFYVVGIDALVINTEYAAYFEGHMLLTDKIQDDTPVMSVINRYYESYYPYITVRSVNQYYALSSVLLWRQAIEAKKSIAVENVIETLNDISFDSTFGFLSSSKNHHISIPIYIVEIVKSGNSYIFDVKFDSTTDYSPDSYSTKYLSYDRYTCDWSGKNKFGVGDKLISNVMNVTIILSLKDEPYFIYILSSSVAAVENVNEKGGIFGIPLAVVFLFYNDNDGTLEKKLRDSMSYVNNKLYVGCTTKYCLNIMQRLLLIDKHKLLLYPKKFEGEICHPSILFSGPIPNQIIGATMTFMTSLENRFNVALLYSNAKSDTWGYYGGVFIKSLDSRFKMTYTLSVGDYDHISLNTVRTMISKLGSGGLIVSFLNVIPLVSLLKNIQIIQPNKNMYDIIQIRINPISITKEIPGLTIPYYFVGGLDAPYVDSDTIKSIYELLHKYTGMDEIIEESVSTVVMFEKLYECVLQAGALDINKIKPLLFTKSLTMGKYVRFAKSDYLFRDIYVYKYEAGTGSIARRILEYEPEPYNWNLPNNFGKICDTSLDVGNNGDVTITVNVVNIILLISESGAYSMDYRGINDVVNLVVQEINNKDGIRGNRIEVTTVDDESDATVCHTQLSKLLNGGDYSAVFTTANSICLDMINGLATEKGVKIFHIGMYGGESCERNIFHIGVDATVVEYIIKRALNLGRRSFAIIGTSDATSLKFTTYAERYINYLYGDVLYSVTLDETTESAESAIRNMVNRITSNASIFYFGTVKLHVLISIALKQLRPVGSDYHFYSFSTSENAAVYGLQPFFAVNKYFSSIDTEANKEFKEAVEVGLAEGIPINSYHEAFYTTLLFWQKVVNDNKNIPINKLDSEYYKTEYESATGVFSISGNNVAKRLTYIASYPGKSEGGFDIISVDDLGTVSVWKQLINNGVYICDLTNSKYGAKYKYPSHKIAVITSLTGDDEARGRGIVSAVQLAIKEINDEGGLAGNKIELDVIDTGSDQEKLPSLSQETAALTGLNTVIGGSWDDEFKIMEPYFSKAKKLLFYPGIALGESCSNFGITTQAVFNQLISAIKATFSMEATDAYGIVYSNSSFSNVAKDIIAELLKEIQVSFHTYVYDSKESLQKILVDYPEGVILLDIVQSYDALKLAKDSYDIGLKPPNYIYYHMLVDELILIGNEEFFESDRFISSWFSVLGKSSLRVNQQLKSFYDKFQLEYKNSLPVTAIVEASYTAVKLWATGVRETGSFDPISIRRGMTGKKHSMATGHVKLEVNNYMSRKIYIAEMKNKELSPVSSPTGLIYPYTFSRWINENEGKSCDFVDHNGEYMIEKIIKIGLIVEKDYQPYQEKYNLWLCFDDTINQLDNDGGINGYEVYGVVKIVSNELIENTTLELCNDSSVKAIVGCITSECRDIVSRITEEKKMIFMYVGNSNGNFFSKYTFTLGSTLSQLVEVSIDYAKQYFSNFFILVDRENEAEYYDTIVAGVKSISSSALLGEKIINDGSECDTVMRKFEIIYVIIALSIANSLKCMEYYIKYDLRLKRFFFINLLFDHYLLGSSDISVHSLGSYIPISYQEEIESSSNYAFHNNAKEKLDSQFYITPYFENTYLAMQFIKLAANTAKNYVSESDPKSHDDDNWPSADYMRLILPGLQYSGPSGQVTIDENNYVKRSVFLMEIIGTGFVQVNPKIGEVKSYEPVPFLEGAPAEYFNTKDVIILKRTEALQYLGLSLFAVNFIALIAAFVFTLKYKDKRVIKCFSTVYHYCLILALLIASGAVLTTIYAPENNSSLICYLRINIVIFAYSIVTSLLTIKARKIRKSKRREVRKIHIPILFGLKIFAINYTFPLIISVLYQTISHSEYQLMLSESETTFLTNSYYEECSSDGIFVAILAIIMGIEMFYGLFQSVQGRKRANEFLDSYMLLLTFIVEFFFSIVLFALEYVIDTSPDSLIVFRGVGYQLVILFITCLQFIPKFVYRFTSDEAMVDTDSLTHSSELSVAEGSRTSYTMHSVSQNMSVNQHMRKSSTLVNNRKTSTLTNNRKKSKMP